MTGYALYNKMWSSIENTYGFLNGDMSIPQDGDLPAAIRFGTGSDHHSHCAQEYRMMFRPEFRTDDPFHNALADACNVSRESGFGLAQFQTSHTPPVFELLDMDDETRILAFQNEPELDVRSSDLLMTGSGPLEIRWDYNGFMMRARKDDESRGFLRDLHSALERGDAYFIQEGQMRNASYFSGLTLMIASRVSDEFKRDWMMEDIDRFKRDEALRDTRIVENLRKAGKGVFAVSPRWAENCNTEYPIVVWVNPLNQSVDSAGMYTIEELEDWATSDKALGALDDEYIAARF